MRNTGTWNKVETKGGYQRIRRKLWDIAVPYETAVCKSNILLLPVNMTSVTIKAGSGPIPMYVTADPGSLHFLLLLVPLRNVTGK